MPNFSQKSLDKLFTCERKLVDICSEAIKNIDFTVICGMRNKVDQDKAVATGMSHTPYPTSKHNTSPAQAVDLLPYPFTTEDWKNIDRFHELNIHMQEAAKKLGYKIRWGGDWNGNGKDDQKFFDYDHFELI